LRANQTKSKGSFFFVFLLEAVKYAAAKLRTTLKRWWALEAPLVHKSRPSPFPRSHHGTNITAAATAAVLTVPFRCILVVVEAVGVTVANGADGQRATREEATKELNVPSVPAIVVVAVEAYDGGVLNQRRI